MAHKILLKTLIFMLDVIVLILTLAGAVIGNTSIAGGGTSGAVIGGFLGFAASSILLGTIYALVQTAQNTERLIRVNEETNRLLTRMADRAQGQAAPQRVPEIA